MQTFSEIIVNYIERFELDLVAKILKKLEELIFLAPDPTPLLSERCDIFNNLA
jgi:hypothetical protein